MSTRHDLAERLAGWALSRAGAGDPPIPLRCIAETMGVTTVRVRDLEAEGETHWTAGGPQIRLRSQVGPARANFTYAHELGHVLVGRFADVHPVVDGLRKSAGLPLEQFCDQIAGALLLPREWALRDVSRDLTLQHLRNVADRSQVSLSALAVRLSRLGWQFALMRWLRVKHTHWLLEHAVGIPDHMRRAMAVHPSWAQEMESLPCSEEVESRRIPLTINRSQITVAGCLVRTSPDRVLMFLPAGVVRGVPNPVPGARRPITCLVGVDGRMIDGLGRALGDVESERGTGREV